MQAPGPGPEQVEQEGWQVVQVAESASLYWPRGQVGKQVPLARSWCRKLVGAQLVQWLEPGP